MHSRVNLDVDIFFLPPVQLLKDKNTDLEVTWPAVWPGLAHSFFGDVWLCFVKQVCILFSEQHNCVAVVC
jgi:hypothetical protein